MPVKSAVVKTVDQVLDMDMSVDNIDTRPSRIRQWFTNNIIRRMFAYPIVWDGVHFKLQKATTDGVIAVASVGGGLYTGPTWSGAVTDAWTEKVFYGVTGGVLGLLVWDKDIKLRVSWNGSEWGTEFTVLADTVNFFDLTNYAIRTKNKVAGQTATYEAICFMNEPYV